MHVTADARWRLIPRGNRSYACLACRFVKNNLTTLLRRAQFEISQSAFALFRSTTTTTTITTTTTTTYRSQLPHHELLSDTALTKRDHFAFFWKQHTPCRDWYIPVDSGRAD
jgi:hypothetical protein